MAGSDVADRMRALLNILCKRANGFNICSLNARSLRPKMDELMNIFVGSNIHAILVCESWLNSNIPSSLVTLPGYRLFRNDRQGRMGGGVAIFVRDCFRSRIVASSNLQSIEFLCVEVDNGSEKCVLSSVYCPPNRFSVEDAAEFSNALSTLSHRYSSVIIGGDFNVNLLNQSNTSDAFRFLFQTLHLNIINNLPTYFNTTNPSLLDLFATTDSDAVLFHNQLSPPSTFDHDFLFLTYDFGINQCQLGKNIEFRAYNSIDVSALHEECAQMPWMSITLCHSIDDQIAILNSIINYLLNKYAPLRSRTYNPKGCPWFSPEIKSLIAERDLLYKRYLRAKTEENRAAYKLMRNVTNTRTRAAKRHYFRSKLDPDLPAKKLWRNLRGAGVCGEEIYECSIDPDSMNTYFTSTNISTIGHGGVLSTARLVDSEPSTPGANEFYFRCVDASEVIGAMNAIKSDATGPDDIPPRFLKLLIPWVIPPVLHIFNNSLTSSQFPQIWKTATVLPLAKNRSPSGPSDFRPISILCFLSKVLEKLIYQQILQYVESNNMLTHCQSGFRAGHSCETALLKVSTDIRKALDKNHISALALLDFSKAFDSVNHSRLLHKLKVRFRFSSASTALIRNFLSGRHQQVKTGSGVSDFLPLVSGVPQGSILGPLLFCLYLNDLPEVVIDSRIHLYADDAQIYLDRPIGLLEDGIERLNEDLRRLSEWSVRNHLQLNPAKSKCLVFYRQQIDASEFPEVILNDTPLPYVNNARNLGIAMNSSISCCDHIKVVVGKIYGTLRRLSAYILPTSLGGL